jgi:ABC-2 type transport system permease protein
LIILALTIAIYLLAFWLNKIRDLGSGLIAAKSGRKSASNFLQTPFGFSFMLVKFIIVGWGIALFIAGASYGSVFGDIESFIGDNEMLQQIFLSNPDLDMTEQFAATLMIISAIIATVPSLSIILKLRTEEKKNRLESIYSKAISRSRLLINHLVLALFGSIALLVLFAIGMWAASSAVMSNPIPLINMLKNALVYLPAIWVMIGIATLLLGLLPKLTTLTWAFLGFSFFAVYLGLLLNLPDFLIMLAPYSHIPQIPVEPMSWLPLIVLTIISLVMIVIGVIGYRKRDLLQG